MSTVGKLVVKTCDCCTKEFMTPAKRVRQRLKIKPNTLFFCSRKCNDIRQKTNVNLICSECGKKFYCSRSQMELRNRATCSIKCRSVKQIRVAEEHNLNNPPTQGILNRRIRYSKKMELWRKAVFERDNYTCQICSNRGAYLQADHIKPFAYFPELRLDISNGRTLCKPCHKTTDTYGYKAKILYGMA